MRHRIVRWMNRRVWSSFVLMKPSAWWLAEGCSGRAHRLALIAADPNIYQYGICLLIVYHLFLLYLVLILLFELFYNWFVFVYLFCICFLICLAYLYVINIVGWCSLLYLSIEVSHDVLSKLLSQLCRCSRVSMRFQSFTALETDVQSKTCFMLVQSDVRNRHIAAGLHLHRNKYSSKNTNPNWNIK